MRKWFEETIFSLQCDPAVKNNAVKKVKKVKKIASLYFSQSGFTKGALAIFAENQVHAIAA
jgi:hypothetical protein